MYREALGWLEMHLLPCPFKSLTGCDCPGCGMQRSILLFLKGKVADSLQMHPCGIPTLFMLVFLVVHLRWKLNRGAAILKWTYITIVATLVINYIVRICLNGFCNS